MRNSQGNFVSTTLARVIRNEGAFAVTEMVAGSLDGSLAAREGVRQGPNFLIGDWAGQTVDRANPKRGRGRRRYSWDLGSIATSRTEALLARESSGSPAPGLRWRRKPRSGYGAGMFPASGN